jgi:hypothetical protein
MEDSAVSLGGSIQNIQSLLQNHDTSAAQSGLPRNRAPYDTGPDYDHIITII